LSSQNTCCCHR